MINLNSTFLCKKINILLTLKFFDILGYYDIALSSFTISHRRFDKSNTSATGKECTSLPFRGHLCSSPLFRVFVLLHLQFPVQCSVDHRLSFFFWQLYCLSFFDLLILVTFKPFQLVCNATFVTISFISWLSVLLVIPHNVRTSN